MFCNKCGKQLEVGSNFCPACGNSLDKKKTSPLLITIIVIMAVLIVGLSAFILVDKLAIEDNVETTNETTKQITDEKENETVNQDANKKDARVENAISALKKEWEKIYSKEDYTDKHLEIIHTRVLTPCEPMDDPYGQIASMLEGKEIAYVVEFELLTNYLNSSPYYDDSGVCDWVIVFKDGSTLVTNNYLRIYASRVYSYDVSGLIANIEDFGSEYNQVFKLK